MIKIVNYSKNFRYEYGVFFSYCLNIACFDNENVLHIYKRTTYSRTTTTHINHIINFVKNTDYKDRKYIIYGDNNEIIDINFIKINHNFKEIILKGEEKTECPILLIEIDEGIETSCGHIFSKEGFNNWIVSKNTCPLCRNCLY